MRAMSTPPVAPSKAGLKPTCTGYETQRGQLGCPTRITKGRQVQIQLA